MPLSCFRGVALVASTAWLVRGSAMMPLLRLSDLPISTVSSRELFHTRQTLLSIIPSADHGCAQCLKEVLAAAYLELNATISAASPQDLADLASCEHCKFGSEKCPVDHSRLAPYPLSVGDLDRTLAHAGPSQGVFHRFSEYATTHKSNKGQSNAQPRIVVLGGSMTEGGGLDDTPNEGKRSPCIFSSKGIRESFTWAGQLEHHLSHFYGAPISVTKNGRSGSSLEWAKSHLSELVPLDTEVVILDYVQNDREPVLASLQVGPDAPTTKHLLTIEAFLIALIDYFGAARCPAVILFATFPVPGYLAPMDADKWQAVWNDGTQTRLMMQHMHRVAKDYEAIGRHYNLLAVVSLQRGLWPDVLTRPEPRVWSNTNWKATGENRLVFNNHPDLVAHKLCADVMFHAWQRLEKVAIESPAADERAADSPAAPYNSQVDLDKLAQCRGSSSSTWVVSSRGDGQGPVQMGSWWRLYEDRPGKPGWIAEVLAGPPHRRRRLLANSNRSDSISFIVPCGKAGGIGIEYLRSYEHMGTAVVEVRYDNTILMYGYSSMYTSVTQLQHILNQKVSRTVTLNGAWTERFSLSDNYFLRGVGCATTTVKYTPVAITIRFNGAPGNTSKFKLLSVFSC